MGQWYAVKAFDEAVTLSVEPGKEYYLRAGEEARGLKKSRDVKGNGSFDLEELKPDLDELK